VWTLYTLFNNQAEKMPREMITLYCGMGFLVALTLHFHTETLYVPTLQESIALVWLGLFGLFIAFNAWDVGIKYGNKRLLSVLTYNNVFFATLLLIAFGQAQFSWPLLFATLGVMIATTIALYCPSMPATCPEPTL
jgi:drug/metabolite transporter (DMT)-like permease